jgi:hypothetical protein
VPLRVNHRLNCLSRRIHATSKRRPPEQIVARVGFRLMPEKLRRLVRGSDRRRRRQSRACSAGVPLRAAAKQNPLSRAFFME